jgi:hypothetical protein
MAKTEHEYGTFYIGKTNSYIKCRTKTVKNVFKVYTTFCEGFMAIAYLLEKKRYFEEYSKIL